MADLQASMCVTGSESLKAFVATLQFLAKVGKDLLFEVEENALVLRALNDAKTSYASVEFAAAFFSRSDIFLKDGLESFSCRINLKQVVAVCKSFRSVHRLCIKAERLNDAFELVLEMTTSNTGVVRTHRFKYSDCDVLNAVFEDAGASSLKSQYKVFSQLLEHVYQSPEIAIDASVDHFKVRSYHAPKDADQDAVNNKKHLATDLNIETSDFDFYDCKLPEDMQQSTSQGGSRLDVDVSCDGSTGGNVSMPEAGGGGGIGEGDNGHGRHNERNELIVGVREMKAILLLCDPIGAEHIQLSFTHPGNPIKFLASKDHIMAQVIMTTIQPRIPFAGPCGSTDPTNSAGSSNPPTQNSGTTSAGKKRASEHSRQGQEKTNGRRQGNDKDTDDDDDDSGPLVNSKKRGSSGGKNGVVQMDEDSD